MTAARSGTAPAPDRGVRGPWWLLAAGGVAVAVHLWGLYRPKALLVVPFSWTDKLEHAVGFGVPVLLLALWLRPDGRRLTPALVVGAVFAVHAVVSEVIQGTFYASRAGDPADVAADLVGVALGLGAYLLLTRRTRRALSSS